MSDSFPQLTKSLERLGNIITLYDQSASDTECISDNET